MVGGLLTGAGFRTGATLASGCSFAGAGGGELVEFCVGGVAIACGLTGGRTGILTGRMDVGIGRATGAGLVTGLAASTGAGLAAGAGA